MKYLNLSKIIIKILLFQISLIPAFVLLFFLKIFRFKVRFGKVKRDNIGNSILELFLYLNDKQRYNYKDFFFYDGSNISNNFLNSVINKSLRIVSLSRACNYLAKKIKLFNTFYLELPTWWNRKKTNFTSKSLVTPKEFCFDKERNYQGMSFLKKHGYNNNKIVCILVRDKYFKKKYSNQNKNWSYHNYRNANIETYRKGINYLLKKKYFVIRIGRGSEKKLYFKNKNYLDYSSINVKDDFLDFWIISKCFFCVTTGSGVDEACSLYKRPILDTNFFPIGVARHGQNQCISIFKKILVKKKKIFLTLSELIELDKKNFSIFKSFHVYQTKKFKNNFTLIDNSSNEILEAIKEIDTRLNKKFFETKKNLQNQKKFWSIFKKSNVFADHIKKVDINSRIGKSFLKSNDWILK